MYDLLTKYINDELTLAERKEFFSLVESDEVLKRELAYAQNLIGLTSFLPQEADERLGYRKLREFKRIRRKRAILHASKSFLKYAAVIVVAIYSSWMFRPEAPIVAGASVAYEEFSTPSGQRATIKLHDGTVVWLNSRTTLRYPNQFATAERRVELDGEAFFEVKNTDNIPFVVTTEKLNIKVLGTKFNVFAYKGHNEFSTSLVEGSVKVYQSKNESVAMMMEANDYVELINNKLVKSHFDNTDFLLWRDGIYAFDNIPFRDIIKKLELYYDVSFVMNNEKLDKYRYTGKFRQRDGVESVLRTLQKIYYFSFSRDDEKNRIIIH